MKNIYKIGATFLSLSMLVLTAISFVKDTKTLFTQESAEYLSSISDVNHILSVVFLVLFLSTLLFIRQQSRKLLLLTTFFLLWIFSGRVVAFKSFPDGRVITGWYYLKANSFNLCTDELDCEGTLFKKTKVKRLPFWFISLENHMTKKTIFIGPFAWKSGIGVFENNIGK